MNECSRNFGSGVAGGGSIYMALRVHGIQKRGGKMS